VWIEASSPDLENRLDLICDECGGAYPAEELHRQDRRTIWHFANVAGWARTARAPDRHVCTLC
jgi:hypothetical protein